MKDNRTRSISITLALIFFLFLLIALTPFASKLPDGLEKLLENKPHKGLLFKSGFADYSFLGIKGYVASTFLAGLLGVAVVFIATCLVMVLVKKFRK